MSKARTESDLSAQLDADLTSRLRELSDLKKAILDAQPTGRSVLLKALVALAYAHWEGSVKFSANKYFEFIAVRKLQYSALNQNFYVNSFLVRLGSFISNKPSLRARSELVSEILSAKSNRFSQIHPDLVNTGSNLKFETLKEICLVCGIDFKIFEPHETFIDIVLLKRRNSIAHGDDSVVAVEEIDGLVNDVIKIMRMFRNELENKVYTKAYLSEARGDA